MSSSLRPFFQPEAIALVGASRDPARIGGRLLQAVVEGGFRGVLYPINPHADVLAGRTALPSLRQLPGPVDLAVIAVPREGVLTVLDDCAAMGIRAALVITSGFAEVGEEGRRLQEQVAEKARKAGIRLIGPNCLGLLTTDPEVCLNASFVPIMPPSGTIAMSSESGAIGLALLVAASRLGLGISSCVSVGNRVDVSSNDLLEYWETDPRTAIVLLYLESFGNPRRFARIARRVARRKPIVAVKAGRTRAGRRAAGSHTAALAANDVAVEALFHQTGVIRAETLEELFDLAKALASQPLPDGKRVAVITNAGGPAILCADACEAGGLILPEFSEATKTTLRSFLPPSASAGNPVDLIASATPEHFRQAVSVIARSGEVDALIIIYISAGLIPPSLVLEAVREGMKGTPSLTLLVCLMAQREPLPPEDSFQESSVPCYPYPEEPARVLAKMAAHAEWLRLPPGVFPVFADGDPAKAREVCQQALHSRGPGWLTTEETRTLLDAFRLPTSPGGVARTAKEAATLAQAVGFPVAVKLASHTIVHKTEVGGVILNLTSATEVERAFEEMRSRFDSLEGVLVQPMMKDGTEVLVGMTLDPLFGPLIAFGLGGIHVEVLGDVCFRVNPLTGRDAAEMVRSLRGSRLLQGYRGHPPADLSALEQVLLRVSALVESVPEVSEMDLNPVFALPPGQGCRIVDARVRVTPTST